MKESARKLVGTDQLCWIFSLGTVTENLMMRWGGKHGAEWDVDEIPWKTETCSFFDCRITSLEGKPARGHVLAEGRSFNKTLNEWMNEEEEFLLRNVQYSMYNVHLSDELSYIRVQNVLVIKLLIEESLLHWISPKCSKACQWLTNYE